MEATGQKGLTLKIAAGVFIGILAALFVYSIPGWVRKHEEEQREQEKMERKSRMMTVHEYSSGRASLLCVVLRCSVLEASCTIHSWSQSSS